MKIHRLVPSASLRTLVASRRLHLVRLCALPVAALAGGAHAQDQLHLIGGGGGGNFHAPCVAPALLTGVEVRSGDYIDALRPLCVTATGPREVSAPSEGAWQGGFGGGVRRLTCPAGAPIVRGMYVGTDQDERVVDDVTLHCSDAAGAVQFDSVSLRSGKGWATRDAVEYCAHGQVAIGLHGRSGRYIDALGLICGAPPAITPSTTVTSIGKTINRVPPAPKPAGWTICDSARDARARNSPAAPNLEAQCLASKTTVASIGRNHVDPPRPADVAVPPTPASQPPASQPPSPPSSSPEPATSQKRAARDAAIEALIGSIVSVINRSQPVTANDGRHGDQTGGPALPQPDSQIRRSPEERPALQLKVIDAATRVPLSYKEVEIYSDNGIRCMKAPCPTNGVEWQGRTNARGDVVIPGDIVQASMTITAGGYGAEELNRAARKMSKQSWLIPLEPEKGGDEVE